jgi:phenylpropionate dioxygenase-like ring-hydroxylating dioxygenase large terminal subunit
MHSMEQSLAETLTERVLKLVNGNTTELADSVLDVDGSFYTDEAQWRAECALMESVPAVGVPSAMLRENNAYVAKTVNNGRRIIITRDDEGKSHVFLNACRHRGAAVMADGFGCEKRFTCPYHNWTYASDGELKGIPFQQGFDTVDRATHGLMELPSEEKHGMIWYMLNPEASIDVDAWLGDFGPELAQWNYDEFEFISHRQVVVPANWKNAVEAFTEFYHFKFVHANSLVGQGTISNVTGFDAFGHNSRLLSALATITELQDDPEQSYFGSQHLGVIYSIFPNLIIANSPLGLEFIHFMPGNSPTEGILFYVGMANQRITDDEAREAYRGVFDGMQEVVGEDLEVITACTSGLNNGLPKIVVGRNEPGTQHFIKSVMEASAAYK